MLKGYHYNALFSRREYRNKIKKVVPEALRERLLDSYDQDHAMIIGEGTKAGIFQSIMMKPPNIQPVYPLREESAAEKQLIHIEPNFNGKPKQGPVVIFNTETLDPRSALYQISKGHDVDDFMKDLSTLGATIGREDYDVVILHEESRKRYFDNSYTKVAQFSRASVADPFNIDFEESTRKHIETEKRPIIWVGQCT